MVWLAHLVNSKHLKFQKNGLLVSCAKDKQCIRNDYVVANGTSCRHQISTFQAKKTYKRTFI